jgi:phage host-nuclease inhibitor protein Gam
MSKNRIKLKPTPALDRSEVAFLVGTIAKLTNHKILRTAEMDAEIALIREQYQADLDYTAQSIGDMTKAVQKWAEANPDEFAKKKSIDFEGGAIGFRTGTPKVATIKGWTFKSVLGALLLRKSRPWVRNTPEIDKDAILAAHAKGKAGDLALLGMKVIQDETFFLQPKLTETETRQVAESKAA